ncbi:MAG: DUF2608 domain-containing protein [Chlamydiales bacterium]|nr:DUF2608 domain-containing protein [Chlamydiales bacterium]
MQRPILNMLLALLCFTTVNGEIIECQRLKEILPYVEEDTLVVFNINNVLTVAYQDAGSTPWAEEHIARLSKEKNISKPHATNLFIPLWHHILVNTDVELFDPDAEAMVNYLQENGVKVLALTNRYTEMAYSTHRNMRSVGIDFARTAPFPEDCWIKEATSPSKYIEGIIFNGLLNFKGDTLATFLKQIDYRPKKLIYIEDKLKHLSQVQKCIQDMGIPFLGIHFGALALQRESYQPELAALQVRFFEDILDDQSAKNICYTDREMTLSEVHLSGENSGNFPVISSLESLAPNVTANALYLIELDHVLWKTGGSIGSRHFYQHYLDKQLELGFSASLAKKNTDRLVEKIHRRAQATLVENTSPAFLQTLTDKNCWSLGLSYRPQSLLTRTNSQTDDLNLKFNSPFKEPEQLGNSHIIFESDFNTLEQKLSGLTNLPSKLVGVCAFASDLHKLKEIANKLNIPFEGYLFASDQMVTLNNEILSLQIECLDRLLTNTEATLILKNRP